MQVPMQTSLRHDGSGASSGEIKWLTGIADMYMVLMVLKHLEPDDDKLYYFI